MTAALQSPGDAEILELTLLGIPNRLMSHSLHGAGADASAYAPAVSRVTSLMALRKDMRRRLTRRR